LCRSRSCWPLAYASVQVCLSSARAFEATTNVRIAMSALLFEVRSQPGTRMSSGRYNRMVSGTTARGSLRQRPRHARSRLGDDPCRCWSAGTDAAGLPKALPCAGSRGSRRERREGLSTPSTTPVVPFNCLLARSSDASSLPPSTQRWDLNVTLRSCVFGKIR
jgi:hypothetical protein